MHEIRTTSCRVPPSPYSQCQHFSFFSSNVLYVCAFRGIAFHPGRGNTIKLFPQRSAIVSQDARQGHYPKWPVSRKMARAMLTAGRASRFANALKLLRDICVLCEKCQLSLSNSIIKPFARFVLWNAVYRKAKYLKEGKASRNKVRYYGISCWPLLAGGG